MIILEEFLIVNTPSSWVIMTYDRHHHRYVHPQGHEQHQNHDKGTFWPKVITTLRGLPSFVNLFVISSYTGNVRLQTASMKKSLFVLMRIFHIKMLILIMIKIKIKIRMIPHQDVDNDHTSLSQPSLPRRTSWGPAVSHKARPLKRIERSSACRQRVLDFQVFVSKVFKSTNHQSTVPWLTVSENQFS